MADGSRAAAPGKRSGVLCPSLHPAENDLDCQRSGVTGLINEAGERFDLAALDREVEAELSPFSQVMLAKPIMERTWVMTRSRARAVTIKCRLSLK
jgi:hypothetical protein